MSKLRFFYDLGLSVIPCSGKRPVVDGWQEFNKVKPNEELIDEWEEKYEQLNVGLCVGPASGIMALDVDIADEKIHKELAPHTTLKRHGRPGRMMYFYRWNGEQGKKNLGGVELYYSTGQVIIDGTHPDTGAPYRLLVPEGLSLEEALEMLPEFPPAAEAAIKSYLDSMPQEEKESKTGNGVLGIGRNSSLAAMAYHEACYMLCTKPPRTEEDIAKQLLESEWGDWFTDKNEPHRGENPMGSALKMVRRAIAKAKERGDFLDPTGMEHVFADMELEETMKEENVTVAFDEHKKTAKYKHKLAEENRKANTQAYLKAKAPPIPERGMIRDIYELSKGFYTEIPSIAIASGIYAMSVFGSKRFFSGEATTNEYVFIIAPTASGKSFAHDKMPEKLLKDIENLSKGVMYSRPVSLPAVVKDIKEHRHISYCLKEAEVFLASMKTSKHNTGMDIGNAVLQLFDNTWLNKPSIATNRSMAAAKEGGGIQSVKYPFMNILCCTTVHQFKNMADKDSLNSGIFGRFLVFPHLYKRNQVAIDNDAEWKKLRDHLAVLCTINKVEENPEVADKLPEVVWDSQLYIPIEIPLWDAEGFRKMVDPNCDEIACISDTDPRAGMAGRFAQHVHKLALIYCISEIQDVVVPGNELLDRGGFKFRRAKNLKIMPYHVEWARSLFFWMLDEVEDIFEEIEFNDEKNSTFISNEKIYATIEYIKRVGSVSWRDLSNKKHLSLRHQKDLIAVARDHGVIVEEQTNKNGSKKITFRYKGE